MLSATVKTFCCLCEKSTIYLTDSLVNRKTDLFIYLFDQDYRINSIMLHSCKGSQDLCFMEKACIDEINKYNFSDKELKSQKIKLSSLGVNC